MIPGLEGLRIVAFLLVFGIHTEYCPKFSRLRASETTIKTKVTLQPQPNLKKSKGSNSATILLLADFLVKHSHVTA